MVQQSAVPASPAEQAAVNAAIVQLDRLLAALDRVVADVADPPVPGSPVAVAYAADQREAFDLAGLQMYAGADHLRAILMIMRGGTLPCFALFTLLRAAAEAGARARHLLEPTLDDAGRMARALNDRLDNIEEQAKLKSVDVTHTDSRIANLSSRASSLGIPPITNKKGVVIAHGEARPSIVELFEKHLPGGSTAFRVLSAYTHSEPWMLAPRSRAEPSSDPRVAMVRTDVNVPMMLAILEGVMELFDECAGFWVVLNGQPLDVWKLARQG